MTPEDTAKNLRAEVDRILAADHPTDRDMDRLEEIDKETDILWKRLEALGIHLGQAICAWYQLGAEDFNPGELARLYEMDRKNDYLSFEFGALNEHCQGVIAVCEFRRIRADLNHNQ
jgi:hypothetical protein